VLGYSPLQAGAALLPLTLVMLAFSARAGALAQRIGPRLPMTLGPVIVALGLLLMLRIDASSSYVGAVLPAVLVFACGLALTVAPLTATVLAAVDERHAGIASGVNNAVARVAGLLAIAVLPSLAGLTGTAYEDPVAFSSGFHTAILICAALVGVAAAIAWLGIRNDALVSGCSTDRTCAVDGPPLRLAAD
jgi:MFS family permease